MPLNKGKKTKAALTTVAAFLFLFLGWYFLDQRLNTDTSPESFQLMAFLEQHSFFELPGFKLKDVDGKSISFDELPKNKIYIVNFWATWCEPCAQEFPSMVKLINAFKDQIEFIAISNDSSTDDIATFVKAFDLNSSPHIRVYWDGESELMRLFKINKLPESFIFDRQGRLVKKIVGTRDWAAPDAMEFFKTMIDHP